MATVDERIHHLIEEHLGISDHTNLNIKPSEYGVNSVTLVAFLKKVNEEFNIDISPSEAANLASLGDFVNHVKSVVG